MKLPERIKRHPYLSGGALAFVLAVGGLETAGYASNPVYDIPAGSCVSPFNSSPTYQDKDTNTVLQTDTGLFTTDVLAQGTLPKGAYGVQASFEAPGAGEQGWDQNVSGMLHADGAGHYAVKMGIGSGAVDFAVRIVAPESLPLCNAAPDVTFTLENNGASGQLPWRNPVNVVTNLF